MNPACTTDPHCSFCSSCQSEIHRNTGESGPISSSRLLRLDENVQSGDTWVECHDFICNDGLFPSILQQGINSLRQDEILCDVILETAGKEILAHRVLLASASHYFRAMFGGCLRESTQQKISLYDVDPEALSVIVDFIYTSRISINEKNVFSVMEVADFLQVGVVQNMCCCYFSSSLSPANCLGIMMMAQSRGYKDLAHQAKRYSLEHFCKVIKEDEFVLLPITELKSILNSEFLNVSGEGQLLEGIVKWVEFHPDDRLSSLPCLLSLIDLLQVPVEQLLACLQSDLIARQEKLFSPLFRRKTVRTHSLNAEEEPWINLDSSTDNIGEDGENFDLLFREEANNEADTQTLLKQACVSLQMAVDRLMAQRCKLDCRSKFFSTAKKQRHSYEQEVIIAIGGDSNIVVLSAVECFTLGYEGWKCSIPTAVALSGISEPTRILPATRQARVYPAVVTSDYIVYLIGGRTQDQVLSCAEYYDVKSNEWLPLTPLVYPVHGASAALLNQQVVLAGGKGEKDVEKRVWAYEEKSNSWEEMPFMLQYRAHHDIAVLHGVLYAVGGLGGCSVKDYGYLNSVERYDPSLGRWTSVCPMHEARAYAGAAVVGSYLYVMGGFNGSTWLRTVERYDPLSNQWTLLAPMTVPRAAFHATVCSGRIYVLGGFDGLRLLSTVEKYNPRTNRWHCAHAMQVRRLGLGAATVKIPLKME